MAKPKLLHRLEEHPSLDRQQFLASATAISAAGSGVPSHVGRLHCPYSRLPEEMRRMKQQTNAEKFERFEAAHGKTVWDEVLKLRREAEGNPNWRPNFMEGVAY